MKNKSNISDSNWEIIARYLVDEADSGEIAEVENWLEESVENREEMEKCRAMLNEVDDFYKTKNFDSISAWNNVKMKIKSDQPKTVHISKTRKAKIVQFYKYAAILVVAVLLGSVGYYFGFINHIPAVYTEVVSAEKQVLDEYILPDGSVIALNSSSTLVFPKQFEDDVREVTISGEAFFDVKPNPEKPFLINAGGTQIKVLGTSFNVRAYPETETVEVIVETGKVQVTQKNGDLLDDTRELFLTPGEKGTLFYKSNLLEKSKNTNINFLAWKTNDIIFKETPLNEVIQCLEKVYHIEIDLADPELENEVLTAHFDKKPVDFVLNVIRLTFNLELTGENEHYTLASRTN